MAIKNTSTIEPGTVQLVYCSRIVDPRDANRLEQDLDDIVRHAQVANARLGITGALLTDRTSFAQVAEGSVASIEGMYSRIVDDKRHHGVELLRYVATHVRLLPLWPLAFVEVGRIPGIGRIDGRSTPLDRRRACASVLAALRPLLLR